MWRMLCVGRADLRLTHGDVSATEDAGAARWEARYTFSQTGRPVINRVSARFRFREGLIVARRQLLLLAVVCARKRTFVVRVRGGGGGSGCTTSRGHRRGGPAR
jgi:hypothetical protein